MTDTPDDDGRYERAKDQGPRTGPAIHGATSASTPDRGATELIWR